MPSRLCSGEIMPQKAFHDLFRFVHSSIILKWIPDLRYKKVLPEEEPLFFEDEGNWNVTFKTRNHCLKIQDEYLVFSLGSRSLSSIERAFIDWSVDKTLEYASVGLDYTLHQALQDTLPRLLVSICLSFPDYDLSYSWKHLSRKLLYFGPTAELYGMHKRENFSEEELNLAHVIYDVLSIVENLSDSTNEGVKFPCTLAFVNGVSDMGGPPLGNIAGESFIKSLSSAKTVFIVNREGELVDYIDIGLENLEDDFVGAFGSSVDFASGQDDDRILNYIFNFQINHPDKDIFFISTKEDGDLFIYKNRTVLFFRRNKTWHFLNYKAISDIVKAYTNEVARYSGDAINLTIIDMLLENSGCCIGLIPRDRWIENFDNIIGTGRVDEFISGSPSISRCFWANTRTIRKRMLSIDGAVLIATENGEIYNVGAIIPNAGASSQGARTTATQAIASMGGIGIKVSDDGYCEIYEPGKKEPSFVIGK